MSLQNILNSIISEFDSLSSLQSQFFSYDRDLSKLISNCRIDITHKNNYRDTYRTELNDLVCKLKNINICHINSELLSDIFKFTRYISLDLDAIRISMRYLPQLTRFHIKNLILGAIKAMNSDDFTNSKLEDLEFMSYSILINYAIVSIYLYDDIYISKCCRYYLHTIGNNLINIIANDICNKLTENCAIDDKINSLQNDFIIIQAITPHWSKQSLLADVLKLQSDDIIKIIEYALEMNSIDLPKIYIDKYSTRYDYELTNLFVTNGLIGLAKIDNCIHLIPQAINSTISNGGFVETDTAKYVITCMSRFIRMGKNCLLLYGNPGNGTTTYINQLSRLLHIDDDPITLYLDDTADYQSLICNWNTSTSVGLFQFDYGLFTKAITEGKWVVVENVDKCSDDVRMLLKEVIQSGKLYIKELDKTLYVHPNFFIFATCKIEDINHFDSYNNQMEPLKSPDISFTSFWPKLYIPPITTSDLDTIITIKYPQILPIKDALIAAFFGTIELIRSIEIEKVPRPSDLLKICKRIANLTVHNDFIDRPIYRLEGYLSESTREMILLAAEGVLFCFIGEKHKRLQIAYKWASYFQLNEAQTEYFITKSRYNLSDACISNISDKNCKYSLTNTHSRVLRQMIECLIANEPILLIGDTGVGKTTAVQTLSHIANKPLRVYVFSDQSEACDLVGSFCPQGLKYKFTQLLRKICYAVSVTCNNDNIATNFIERLNCMVRNSLYNDFITTMSHFVSNASKFDIWKDISVELRILAREIKYNQRTSIVVGDLPKLLQQLNLSATNSIIYDIDDAEPVSFKFQDGILTQCIRNGEWILLDELNLAPSHLLQRLVGIIKCDNMCKYFDLFENSERIPIHPEFKLFACLNPSKVISGDIFEYSGKKDLAPSIKRLFTEIYLDELTDSDDLCAIMTTYFPDKQKYHVNIINFYLQLLEMAKKSQLICADMRSSPVYSLRNLSRTLTYTKNFLDKNKSSNFLDALRNGFLSCFGSSLSQKSEFLICQLFDKLFIHNPTNLVENMLNLTSSEEFIVTNTVKTNLIKISRVLEGLTVPILLEGPTSVGKTNLIKYLAQQFNREFVRINNHENTDLQEYLGSFSFNQVDNQIVFNEGVLVQAARNGHWLLLDELNLAPSEVLEALNRILDDNREIIITETNTTITPHPNFVIFATQNPANSIYGGRKQFSRALKNRFIHFNISELPFCEWEEIIHQRFKLPKSRASAIVNIYKDMYYYAPPAMAFLGSTTLVTTRDIVKWCNRSPVDDVDLVNIGWFLMGERQRTRDSRDAFSNIFNKHFPLVKVSTNYLLSGFIQNVTAICPEYIINESSARLITLIHNGLRAKEPILLIGETGTGKTTCCQVIAKVLGLDITIVNLHLHTDASDLIGSIKPTKISLKSYKSKLHRLISLLYDYGKYFIDSDQLSLVISEQIRDCVEYLGSFSNVPSLDEYNTFKQVIMNIISSTVDYVKPAKKPCKNTCSYIKQLLNELCPLDKFEWKDGPVVETMRKGGILVLDEISLAEDAVLEKLNPVLEGGVVSLTLTDKNSSTIETVVAHEKFFIIATMNPGNDFGKRELSPALSNRFTQIWVPQPKIDSPEFNQFLNNLIKTDVKNIKAQRLSDLLQEILIGLYKFEIKPSIRDIKLLIDYLTSATSNGVTISNALVDGFKILFIYPLSESVSVTVEDFIFGILSGYFPELTLENNLSLTSSFDLDKSRILVNKIQMAISFSRFILLEGPAGVGKTSAVSTLSKMRSKRLIKINISQQTELMDLVGTFVPSNSASMSSNFSWKDGPIVEAMKNGDWVLLDEINLASQPVLEGLNSLLDHRREIYLAEIDQIVNCHPHFFLFASQNSAYDGGGRKFLPKSFLNRFTVIRCNTLDHATCNSIIRKLYPTLDPSVITLVTEIIYELDVKFAGLGYYFNLRDAIRLCNCLNSDSPKKIDVYSCLLSRFKRKNEFLQASEIVYKKISILSFQNPAKSIIETANLLCNQHHLLELLYNYVSSPIPVVITGPDQSGKSTVVRELARLVGTKLVEIPIFPDTDAYDLLGSFEQISSARYLSKFHQLVSLQRNLLQKDYIKLLLSDTQELATQSVEIDNIFARHTLPNELVSAWENVKSLSNGVNPQFRWIDGVLVDAIANGHWVLLKRVDLAQPAIIDRLNSLLEVDTAYGVSGTDGENFILFECGYFREIPIKRANAANGGKGFKVFMTNSYQSNLSKPILNRCLQINILPFDNISTSTFVTPYMQFISNILKVQLSNHCEINIINSLKMLVRQFTLDCFKELIIISTVFAVLSDVTESFDLPKLLFWARLFHMHCYDLGEYNSPANSPKSALKNSFDIVFTSKCEFNWLLEKLQLLEIEIDNYDLVRYVKYLLEEGMDVNQHSYIKYLVVTKAPLNRLYSSLSVMADTLGIQSIDSLGISSLNTSELIANSTAVPQVDLFFALYGISIPKSHTPDSMARFALLDKHSDNLLLDVNYKVNVTAIKDLNWSFLYHMHPSHLVLRLFTCGMDTQLSHYRNCEITMEIYSKIYSCIVNRLNLLTYDEAAISSVVKLENSAFEMVKKLHIDRSIALESQIISRNVLLSCASKRLLIDIGLNLTTNNTFPFILEMAKKLSSNVDIDLLASVALVNVLKSTGSNTTNITGNVNNKVAKFPKIVGLREFCEVLQQETIENQVNSSVAVKTELYLLLLKNALKFDTAKVNVDEFIISNDQTSTKDIYQLIYNTPYEYFERIQLPDQIIKVFKESLGIHFSILGDNPWINFGYNILSNEFMELIETETLYDMKISDFLAELKLWENRSREFISAQSDLAILSNPYNVNDHLYDTSILLQYKFKLYKFACLKIFPRELGEFFQLSEYNAMDKSGLDNLITVTKQFVATFFNEKVICDIISKSLLSDAVNIANHTIEFLSDLELRNPFAIKFIKPIQIALYSIAYGILSQVSLGTINSYILNPCTIVYPFSFNVTKSLLDLISSNYCNYTGQISQNKLLLLILKWSIINNNYDEILPILKKISDSIMAVEPAEYIYKATNLQKAIEYQVQNDSIDSNASIDEFCSLLFPLPIEIRSFLGIDHKIYNCTVEPCETDNWQIWEAVGSSMKTKICELIKDTYKLSTEYKLGLFKDFSQWICRLLNLIPNKTQPGILLYYQALNLVLDTVNSCKLDAYQSDIFLDNLISQVKKMLSIKPTLLTLNTMVSLLETVKSSLEQWNKSLSAQMTDPKQRTDNVLYFDIPEFERISLKLLAEFITSWEFLPNEKLGEMSINAYKDIPILLQLTTQFDDCIDISYIIGDIDKFLTCPLYEYEMRLQILQLFAKIAPNPLSKIFSNTYIIHSNSRVPADCNDYLKSAKIKLLQVISEGTRKIDKAQIHKLKRSAAKIMHQYIKDISASTNNQNFENLIICPALVDMVKLNNFSSGNVEMYEYIDESISTGNKATLERCLKDVKQFSTTLNLTKSRGYNYHESLCILDTDWQIYHIHRDCQRQLIQLQRLIHGLDDLLLLQLICHSQKSVISSFEQSLNDYFVGKYPWDNFTSLYHAFTSLLRGLEVLNQIYNKIWKLFNTFNEFYNSISKSIEVVMVSNCNWLDKTQWAVNDIYQNLTQLIGLAQIELERIYLNVGNRNIKQTVKVLLQIATSAMSDIKSDKNTINDVIKSDKNTINDDVGETISSVLLTVKYYEMIKKIMQLNEQARLRESQSKQADDMDEWIAGTGLANAETGDGQTNNLEQQFDENSVDYAKDSIDMQQNDTECNGNDRGEFNDGVSDDELNYDSRTNVSPNDLELSSGDEKYHEGIQIAEKLDAPADSNDDSVQELDIGSATPSDQFPTKDDFEDGDTDADVVNPQEYMEHSGCSEDEKDSHSEIDDGCSEDEKDSHSEIDDGCNEFEKDTHSEIDMGGNSSTEELEEFCHLDDKNGDPCDENICDDKSKERELSDMNITQSVPDKDGLDLTSEGIISHLDVNYEKGNSSAIGQTSVVLGYGESTPANDYEGTNISQLNIKNMQVDHSIDNPAQKLNDASGIDMTDITDDWINAEYGVEYKINFPLKKHDSLSQPNMQMNRFQGLCVTNGYEVWKQLQQQTISTSIALGEQLKRILEPTIKGRFQGYYKSGKRLCMRKVMLFIASGYKKDKIWMRRTKLTKFGHYIMLALDNSASMLQGGGGQLLVNVALESFALITQALNRIDIDNICIYSFGSGEPRELLPMNQKISGDLGGKLVENFTFDESSDDSHQKGLANMLLEAHQVFSKINDNAKKIIFIITDGKFNKKMVSPIVERLIKSGLIPVLLIIDRGPNDPLSMVNMKQVIQDGKNIKIESFFHNFPFPLYAIIHNVDALPSVLCDLIRHWFNN